MKLSSWYSVLILVILTGLAYPIRAEIRAIWVLPWSTNTPDEIDAFIENAIASSQTDVFVEIRYRSDAMYQTNRVPDCYPNPEPRSYILKDSNLDPLEYVLEIGHANNLRVHAWFVVFNATPLDSRLIKKNYIFKNHPEWITYNKHSQRRQNKDQFGYFIDPGIPEVQDYLLNIIGDLLSGYPDLDGLHLDYIRYPDTSLGYHPTSVSRFNEYKTNNDITWNQWRALQVTSFVEKTRALVDSLNPELVLSAAVIANYYDAVEYYAQEWQVWLDNDLVDYVYPMAYQTNISKFTRQLNVMKEMQHDDSIVVGIRAWSENGISLMSGNRDSSYNIMDVAERIGVIRNMGFAGIALFSYDGLMNDNALTHLTQIAYSNQIASNQTSLMIDSPDTPLDKTSAGISIRTEGSIYNLELLIPSEGKWHLRVMDTNDETIYERNRYYLEGVNQDYWDGVLDDGSLILPGIYRVGVFRDADNLELLAPLDIPGLGF